jgi:hypothetical protein
MGGIGLAVFPPEGMQDSHDVESMEWEVGSGAQSLMKANGIVENVIKGGPLPVQPFEKATNAAAE